MALQERKYLAAARTELERDIRRLEERSHAMSTKDLNYMDVNSKVDFSLSAGLINAQQAEAYKERLLKAHQAEVERRNFERTESREIVDDYGTSHPTARHVEK